MQEHSQVAPCDNGLVVVIVLKLLGLGCGGWSPSSEVGELQPAEVCYPVVAPWGAWLSLRAVAPGPQSTGYSIYPEPISKEVMLRLELDV